MLQVAGAIPIAQLAGRKHTKETLKVAVGSWLPAGNIRREKRGFLAPLSRWLQGSHGAEWTTAAASVLPELLDPESLATPRDAFQLLLLDRWLARWNPAG